MTEGSISKKIILFALPIFFGQLLQQLYNVVDTIVVGRAIDEMSLAAVNSSGSLIFLMVGFINGLFMGAGVIIGNRYGAKDYEAVKTATHTAVAFGLIMGVVLTISGIFFAPKILVLMGTPESVLPLSVKYLRIFFMGGLANVLYNTCCGIFNAMGDSKHPLYYLIISAFTNMVLDLTFVLLLGMKIEGVAIATVISQYLSAALAFTKLTRVDGPHRIYVREIGLDMPTLKKELRLGVPTGVQNSVIAIANVIVQSKINFFGAVAMAGCGCYSRLEGFAFLPIMSFSATLTTFISQNLGAGNYERAKKGARFGVITGVALAEVIGVFFFLFSPIALRLFTDSDAVISYGQLQFKTEALFFCLLAFSHCMAGIMRGAGRTSVPMFVMLGCWCLIRISYISIAVKYYPYIRTVFMAYPITWSLSSICFTVYYFKEKIFDGEK